VSSQQSLGLVPLDEKTVEHDFIMLERFQDFSAELLRIALLGISAIGFAVSKLLFPEHDLVRAQVTPGAKVFLAFALIALSVSAAAALAHRYSSANSMSWHLQAMRRYKQGDAKQVIKADSESKQRHKNFKTSRTALACSAIALAVGAASLAIAVWLLL
jgi:uncharacterized membrane protein YidH (DUF202 family)